MSGFVGTGLTIGDVTLTDFEVPNTIPWGTKQIIKEFTYPGGKNRLQTLGPTRMPITWEGQFISPDATDRARLLDQMCATGAIVQVGWGDLNFDAVVEDFKADYKHQWQGRYSISLRVFWDYQDNDPSDDPQTDAYNDLNQALQIATLAEGLAAALALVAGVPESDPVPGAIIAAQAGIQVALGGLGAAAAGSGATLIAAVPSPLTIGSLVAAGATSASSAAAFAFTARAAINWQQVPGASTPAPYVQPQQPDLSNYAGA